MKRAIIAAMLMLIPAAAFAQDNHPLVIPKVPQLSLVPTRYEMELLRPRKIDREWIDVMHTMPQYRAPLFGDYEQELRWESSPFGSLFPVIVPFRF